MGERRLIEFLTEAELDHYADSIQHVLFVSSAGELQNVDNNRLAAIGMSKPEIRRLRKFCEKEHPKGAFGKIKKMFSVHGTGDLYKSAHHSRHGHKSFIPESAIGSLKSLGGGRYGTVQQGIWTTDGGQKLQVAIKCLNHNVISASVDSELQKTVTILQCLDHENVLRVYGECLRDPLLQHSFPIPRLCAFTQQICSAMRYLESKRIVHGDLAVKNVMVVSKVLVKVSDCCLSRIISSSSQLSTQSFINQSCPWLAPEYMRGQKFSIASDVWSFGVMMWEMFSYGAQPWSGWATGKIQEAVLSGQCLECPAACPAQYNNVMSNCWQLEPKLRPTFSTIYNTLQQIVLEQLRVLVDPSGSPASSEMLTLRVDDIVTVLDKRSGPYGNGSMWLGVVGPGVVGYFNPNGLVPYHDMPAQMRLKSQSLDRRTGSKQAKNKKLSRDMISLPQGDFRHVAHIGLNGNTFGNVTFLDSGEVAPAKSEEARHSLPPPRTSQSDMCLGQPNYRLSGVSTATSGSSCTLTEVDGIQFANEKPCTQQSGYDEFDDFRMPMFTDSVDYGSSLVDEVFKEIGAPIRETNMTTGLNLNDKYHHPTLSSDNACLSDDVSNSTVLAPNSFNNIQQPPSPEYKIPTNCSIQERRARGSNSSLSSDQHLKLNCNQDMDSSQLSLNGCQETKNTKTYRVPQKQKPSSLVLDVKGSSSSLQRKSSVESPTNESPSEKDNKKRQKMLKILVPPTRERTKSSSGVKTMTPAEEKELNKALEMAAQITQQNARELMIPNSPGAMSDGKISDEDKSPRFHSVFNFTNKFRRQSSKDKSSEDVRSSSNSNLLDEPSVEAQEAYNVLVARGLSHSGMSSDNFARNERMKRDNRIRRTFQQQSSLIGGNGEHIRPAPRMMMNTSNIRHPQGIPGREIRPVVNTDEDDSNPLRKLRANGGMIPRMYSNRQTYNQQSNENNAPVWNAQMTEDDPPLPPRRPATFMSVLNRKPRERKYPLPTDPIISPGPSDNHYNCAQISDCDRNYCAQEYDVNNDYLNSSSFSLRNGQSHSTVTPSNDLMKSSSCLAPLKAFPQNSSNSFDNAHFQSSLNSSGDKDHKVCEKSHYDNCTIDVTDSSVAPPRYSPDSASYEDMLDCVLESPQFNFARSEQFIYDEVQKVKTELGGQATTEDCMYALEETGWDVASAVHLLQQQKQYSSFPSNVVKRSLDTSLSWDASSRDTGYLTEPCPDSPDVVHM